MGKQGLEEQLWNRINMEPFEYYRPYSTAAHTSFTSHTETLRDGGVLITHDKIREAWEKLAGVKSVPVGGASMRRCCTQHESGWADETSERWLDGWCRTHPDDHAHKHIWQKQKADRTFGLRDASSTSPSSCLWADLLQYPHIVRYKPTRAGFMAVLATSASPDSTLSSQTASPPRQLLSACPPQSSTLCSAIGVLTGDLSACLWFGAPADAAHLSFPFCTTQNGGIRRRLGPVTDTTGTVQASVLPLLFIALPSIRPSVMDGCPAGSWYGKLDILWFLKRGFYYYLLLLSPLTVRLRPVFVPLISLLCPCWGPRQRPRPVRSSTFRPSPESSSPAQAWRSSAFLCVLSVFHTYGSARPPGTLLFWANVNISMG